MNVVLVHGSRLASAQWSPVVPHLKAAAEIEQIHTPDLPGHGTRATAPFTLSASVQVIEESIARAGGPVVLVGHSLGGYVAMTYAERHPESLAALVLADCAAEPRGVGAAAYRRVVALTDRIGPEGMTRVNDRVLRRMYASADIEPVIAGGYYFEHTRTAWFDVMTHCGSHQLRRFPAPVVIVNGRFDQFRLGTREFRRAIPRSEVRVIGRAGHLSCLDQPWAFAEEIVRVASAVKARGGSRAATLRSPPSAGTVAEPSRGPHPVGGT